MIEVHGEVRDQLLAIKQGEVPLEQALRWTDEAAIELEAARRSTHLPAEPDHAAADRLVLEAREWAAQAWLERAPGPWGRDAPSTLVESAADSEEAKDKA